MTHVIAKRPPLTAGVLESISLVLADTASGLTGSQIGKLLMDSDLVDIDPTNSKWKRLFNSFVDFQNRQQCSNHILKFIQKALGPVKYLGRQDVSEERRHRVNQILSFAGYELSERGKYRHGSGLRQKRTHRAGEYNQGDVLDYAKSNSPCAQTEICD